MISLLHAAYLFGAIAVAAPLILHLINRRPTRPQRFPSFFFLRATTIHMQRRNDIRRWLLLLMRCLLLLLLALAFSWPYLPKFKKPAESMTVMLWDRSVSMQAETCRQDLLDQAGSLISKATDKRPLLIAAVGDGVTWSGDFSDDSAALNKWFQENCAGYGTSRFERAIRLADRRLQHANAKKKRIVLITDRQLIPWQDVRFSEKLSPGVEIETVFPRNTGFKNIAVTKARIAAPLTGAEQQLPLLVTIRNFHSQPSECDLVTTFLGKVVDTRQVQVPALNSISFPVNIKAAALEPVWGSVQLKAKDDLVADNAAWFVANPVPAPKVFLQDAAPARRNDVDFIRAAFAPANRPKAAEIIPLQETQTEKELSEARMVVLRSGLDPASPLAITLDKLTHDGLTLVAVWRDTPLMRQFLTRYGIRASSSIQPETRRLGLIAFDNEIFQPFLGAQTAGLFNVLFFDSPKLAMPEGARMIAQFDNGAPAIAEVAIGAGRLVVVASEISRAATDWPARASFLPFWRQLLYHACRSDQDESNCPAATLPFIPDGVTSVTEMTSGRELVSEEKSFTPQTPGAYLVELAGEKKAYSVNTPPEESDPLPVAKEFSAAELVSKEVMKQDVALDKKEDPEAGKPFWRLILFGALGLMIAEVVTANKTAM